MNAQHTPGRRCDACEGFCLVLPLPTRDRELLEQLLDLVNLHGLDIWPGPNEEEFRAKADALLQEVADHLEGQAR